jgi:tripartite-type tricarboxylate transporter receptor subunit TctC
MTSLQLTTIAMLGAIAIGAANSQEYPAKTIRIITAGVGGGNDFSARQLAQGVSGPLGQQIVVVNQSVGVIPARQWRAPPPMATPCW